MTRSALVVAVVAVVVAACATTPTAQEAIAPCARARLAREFPATPLFHGCFVVERGPDALVDAGIIVLTELAEDHLEDEAPRYRLATTQPLFPAAKARSPAPVTTSWEQLSSTQARLSWLSGTRGVEVCVAGSNEAGAGLDGDVVVIDDQPPFAHLAGRVQLRRVSCPG